MGFEKSLFGQDTSLADKIRNMSNSTVKRDLLFPLPAANSSSDFRNYSFELIHIDPNELENRQDAQAVIGKEQDNFSV